MSLKSKILSWINPAQREGTPDNRTSSISSEIDWPEQDWIVFKKVSKIIAIDQSITRIKNSLRLHCVAIEFKFSDFQLNSNGMPTGKMTDVYYGLEDNIDRLDELFPIRKIANSTGEGVRNAWYCSPSAEIKQRLLEIVETEKLVKISIYDSSIEMVSAFLPTDLDGQIAGNHNIIENITELGDDGSEPREVMHWIFPSDQTNIAEICKALAARGYKIEGSDGDRIRFSNLSDVLRETVDRETMEISKLCQQYGFEYDGWETPVVPVGRTGKLH